MLPMEVEVHLDPLEVSWNTFSPEARCIPEVAEYMEVVSESDSGSDLGYTLHDLEEIWGSDDSDDSDDDSLSQVNTMTLTAVHVSELEHYTGSDTRTRRIRFNV